MLVVLPLSLTVYQLSPMVLSIAVQFVGMLFCFKLEWVACYICLKFKRKLSTLQSTNQTIPRISISNIVSLLLFVHTLVLNYTVLTFKITILVVIIKSYLDILYYLDTTDT